MGQINYYSHIDSERLIIKGVGKVCDLMPHKDFKNSIIIVAGRTVDEEYEVKENDIVFVRDTPTEAFSTVIAVISVIAAVAGVVVGIVAAVKNKEMQEKLEKSQKASKAMASSPDALPFLKGANNQPATGRTFPYVIGEHYFTPHRLAPKYFEVDGAYGENEYTNMILETGFSPIVVKEMKVGEHTIYMNDSDVPDNILTNFPDNSIYYDEQNVIEIRQSEEFSTPSFKKKIVSDYILKEIEHDYGTLAEDLPVVVQDAQEHAKSIDVCILFNGLRKYVDGSWTSQSATVECYWSNVNTPDPKNPAHWNQIHFKQPLKVGSHTEKAVYSISVDSLQYKTDAASSAPCPNGTVADYARQKQSKWEYVSGSVIDFETSKVLSVSVLENNTYVYKREVINDTGHSGAMFGVKKYLQFCTGPAKVEITFDVPDYSYVESDTFNYNRKRQLRFLAHKDFSPSESYGKHITVMLKRTTPCAENNSQEDCYLNFINTEVYDTSKSSSSELVACSPLEERYREKCTRIGIRMKASKITEDLTDNVNVLVAGCARIWDSDATAWTTEKVPTRNPASWVLEVLTSDVHGTSAYSDDEIDLESIGALYEYCVDKGYHVDGVITESMTKETILSNILLTCNASLIYNNDGLLEVCYDDVEEYPVALLNTQDITDVSIVKKMTRGTTGRKVTFINRESWETESAYVMSDGTSEHDADDVVTELAPTWITEYTNAARIARRSLLEEKLQPREVTVTVGREGGYYPLYSCVDVQLPHLVDGGTSASIKSMTIVDNVLTEIHLDQMVDFAEGKQYGIIAFVVKDNARGFFTAKVSGTGLTDILDVTDYEGVAPVAGNILSFGLLDDEGEFTRITSRMKICNIKRNDEGYKLVLKDYNPAIYSEEEGCIPEYTSNAVLKPSSRRELDAVPVEVVDALDEQSEMMKEYIDSIGVASFDVSPEMQTMPVSVDGVPIGTQNFKFTCTVYNKGVPYEGDVEYHAYQGTAEVGSWNENVLTIPGTICTSDNNLFRIDAITDDGYSFSSYVTVAKLYSGDPGDAKFTTYEIGLSDTIVKVDEDGLNPDPAHIIPKKMKKTESYLVETDYGYVTASVDGGEESIVGSYSKVTEADTFSEKTTYYRKAKPFYMTVDGEALCNDDLVIIGMEEL